MIRELTASNTVAEVQVNNKKVGEIHAYSGENRLHWHNQTLILDNEEEPKVQRWTTERVH